MKKHIHKFTKFTKTIGKGVKLEMRETIEIPSLIKNKEYKKAGGQVVDLFKMTGLAIVWVVPGGAVITAMILKFSHKARPSAFRSDEESSDSLLLESNKNNAKDL